MAASHKYKYPLFRPDPPHLLISSTLHLFNSTSLIVDFKLQSLIGGPSLLLESSSLSSLLRSSREKLDHRLAKNRVRFSSHRLPNANTTTITGLQLEVHNYIYTTTDRHLQPTYPSHRTNTFVSLDLRRTYIEHLPTTDHTLNTSSLPTIHQAASHYQLYIKQPLTNTFESLILHDHEVLMPSRRRLGLTHPHRKSSPLLRQSTARYHHADPYLNPQVVAHKPRMMDPWAWKPTGPRCKYNEKGVYGCFGQPIGQEEKYPEDAGWRDTVPEGGRWPGTPGGHA
jgi:hypothetical protein